jgi:nucleotide-binding universal stress UspA family protein
MDKSSFQQPERRSTNQMPAVMRLRRILVPIDFGESTIEALRYAAAFAREYKATITLLHVVKPDGSEAKRELASVSEDLVEKGERQLRKLIDVIWGDEIVTDIVVATGKPYLQIVNEAKETSADMILMASHGPVGTWGLIRRGTATKVVRHAPCPVLVVRPFGHGFVRDGVVERCIDY